MPTGGCLQVLESEMRTRENAIECPYLVEWRCPHAGTLSNVQEALRIRAMIGATSSRESAQMHREIAGRRR
jgi:hypothetical protein